MADIESVKATAQVFAPINMEIVAANRKVLNDPKLINEDPENEGWIIEGEIDNERDLEFLLDDKSYSYLVEQQNRE